MPIIEARANAILAVTLLLQSLKSRRSVANFLLTSPHARELAVVTVWEPSLTSDPHPVRVKAGKLLRQPKVLAFPVARVRRSFCCALFRALQATLNNSNVSAMSMAGCKVQAATFQQ